MSLSRQDVFLGRALIAWGLVDRDRLTACAEEVRRSAAEGRPLTLGQVLVRQRLLSPEYYQAIVARLRQLYVESTGAPSPMQRATEQMPQLNESGRYLSQQPQAGPPPPRAADTRAVERAVQRWQQVAPQVTASGSQIEIEFDFEPARVPLSSPTPAPAAATPAPAQPGKAGRRQGPDAAIRRRLKVPEDQQTFLVGAWTVEQYLADGAQGVVYRVTRQGSSTPFALKVLKQHEPKPEVRQRFVREAQTMAKLTHPGIVHVHDAGVAGGLLWFVMDFLAGPTLKGVLEEQERLPIAEGLRVMQRLCEAVAYAHGHGVLHRDLKPDNVIMAQGRDPVLTDFGLAKDTQSTMNLTAEGQRIGTPLYMAPELLLDAEVATPQSEVYALAAMLYQVLTGKVPFFAKSVIDLAELIEKGKLAPLREACPDAPKALEKLCARALHKDPGKRPQTVEELRAELAGMG
ncbi:MAG: serine/threonine protein kinase [Planctomycetes bacterium]|nr:serine/threonine protein kinase [Planctomycetota bacterium]